jgi:hypothetical protein
MIPPATHQYQPFQTFISPLYMSSVAAMASSMPYRALRLPFTAVRGWVRPLMPKMKRMAATT